MPKTTPDNAFPVSKQSRKQETPLDKPLQSVHKPATIHPSMGKLSTKHHVKPPSDAGGRQSRSAWSKGRLGCRERHIRVSGRAANGTFAAFNDRNVPFATPHRPRKCLSRHQQAGCRHTAHDGKRNRAAGRECPSVHCLEKNTCGNAPGGGPVITEPKSWAGHRAVSLPSHLDAVMP